MGVKMGNESDLKEAIITRYLLGIFRKWYRSDNGKKTQKLSTIFRKRQKDRQNLDAKNHTITLSHKKMC